MKLDILNNTAIVYFHGFNSSPEGGTCKALQNYFGKERIFAPFYDYIDPDNAYKHLDSILVLQKNISDVFLVGTSLGGFWANYFSEKYNISCVLINPSLRPMITLQKYLGENVNFYTAERKILSMQHIDLYSNYPVKDSMHINKTILIGKKDTLVNPAYAIQFFRKHRITIDDNEGHQILDKGKIIRVVEESLNNLSCYGDGD